jgi:hypothetical protein
MERLAAAEKWISATCLSLSSPEAREIGNNANFYAGRGTQSMVLIFVIPVLAPR